MDPNSFNQNQNNEQQAQRSFYEESKENSVDTPLWYSVSYSGNGNYPNAGEGIPPEKIKEIWDRYYRVDREHRRAVTGTGLGLSIVKGVMEAHGASYGVESAVGAGSVFWFELPICFKE